MSLQSQEYDRLVREMESNASRIFQIISLTVTFTAAVMGFAIPMDGDPSMLLLVPNVMAIPALFLVSSQRRSTSRIASYIATFYENKKEGIGWEKRLLRFKEPSENRSKKDGSWYDLGISFVFLAISITSFFFSAYFIHQTGEKEQWFWFQAFALLCLILYSLGFRQLSCSSKRDKFKQDWEKMKQEEEVE